MLLKRNEEEIAIIEGEMCQFLKNIKENYLKLQETSAADEKKSNDVSDKVKKKIYAVAFKKIYIFYVRKKLLILLEEPFWPVKKFIVLRSWKQELLSSLVHQGVIF